LGEGKIIGTPPIISEKGSDEHPSRGKRTKPLKTNSEGEKPPQEEREVHKRNRPPIYKVGNVS